MVSVRAAETVVVVIVNEAEGWPEGTTTKEGTIAVESLDCRLTLAPTIDALSAIVTVPLTVFPFPPTTEVLAKASCRAGITVT